MTQQEMELILQLSDQRFLECLEAQPPKRRKLWMKTRCAIDPRLFAKAFFAHHCRLPESSLHAELFERHIELGAEPLESRRGRRFALAAPRGAAKSTLTSLILALHDVLYQRERYILILSATLKQAVQRLRNLRAEVIENQALRAVFAREIGKLHECKAHSMEWPGARIDVFGSGAEIRGLSYGPWRPTKIILDDAENSEAVESAARREKLLEWFQEVVEHLGDRYTHILAVGTVLHPESLLSRLLERPDFEARRFRSIERFSPRDDLWGEWRRRYVDLSNPKRVETARRFYRAHREDMTRGVRVLWPEKEDYYDLMTQLVTQGRRAFYQEKQNEPMGSALALFDPAAARRFRREGARLLIYPPKPLPGESAAQAPTPTPQNPSQNAQSTAQVSPPKFERAADITSLRIAAFLDPALGKGAGAPARSAGESDFQAAATQNSTSGGWDSAKSAEASGGAKGDFAALAIAGAAPDGAMYLLEMWVRRASPLEQLRALLDAHERWGFARAGVEGNCFQELLAIPFEQERRKRIAAGRPAGLTLEMVTHRRNKIERIAALEPLVSNGWLLFSEDLPEEFWRQFQSFPGGGHDDALDALEGAVDFCRRAAAAPSVIKKSAAGTARVPKGLREY